VHSRCWVPYPHQPPIIKTPIIFRFTKFSSKINLITQQVIFLPPRFSDNAWFYHTTTPGHSQECRPHLKPRFVPHPPRSSPSLSRSRQSRRLLWPRDTQLSARHLRLTRHRQQTQSRLWLSPYRPRTQPGRLEKLNEIAMPLTAAR